jgi:hypothetical protein
MSDAYGSWKVVFQDRNGRKTEMVLVDRKSEVREQARFFAPSYGQVVSVQPAK